MDKDKIPVISLSEKKTTYKMQEILDSGHQKICIDMDYVVSISKEDENGNMQCYCPSLLVYKIDSESMGYGKDEITITELKKSAHTYKRKKKEIINYNFITYFRDNGENKEANLKSYKMTQLAEKLDKAIQTIEGYFIEKGGINTKEMYNSLNKIEDGIEIIINISESIKLDQFIDFYVKGQNIELHEKTRGKCYGFMVYAIKIKYFVINLYEEYEKSSYCR